MRCDCEFQGHNDGAEEGTHLFPEFVLCRLFQDLLCEKSCNLGGHGCVGSICKSE